MAKKLTTEQVWKEWQKFRKNLNDVAMRDKFIEVDFEYDLGNELVEDDVEKMIKLLESAKNQLENIKESIK